MSDEQTNCTRCGALILVLTAQERGGLCVPCARGEREQIEEGKKRYAADKEFRQSPVWLFWEQLCSTDFARMTQEEKFYWAVNCLRGGVINGGFHQYFFYRDGLFYPVAEQGLQAIGAERTLVIARQAKAAVFGDADVSEIAQERLLKGSLKDKTLQRELDRLDRLFYEDPDDLWAKLQAFGVKNGFYSEAWQAL